MSIEKMTFRKLLRLFFADDRLQRRLLLSDIHNDQTKDLGIAKVVAIFTLLFGQT